MENDNINHLTGHFTYIVSAIAHYMKNLILVLIIILFSGSTFAQGQIIHEKDIPNLNTIIKSLENDYRNTKAIFYNSLPQTTASYFEIVTKLPDNFVAQLNNSNNLKQLEDMFSGLQVDKDVLIVKNVYYDYNNEKKIEIKSFEIENNRNHSITIGFNDSLNNKDIKTFYSSYKSRENKTTTIRGFYLNESFKAIAIPKVYSDWVSYTDVLVKPEISVFYDKKQKEGLLRSYKKTIIDSLVSYYQAKTQVPPFNDEQELVAWQSKMQNYPEALYKTDQYFKRLLHNALKYAEDHNVSNGDLEYLTAQLISKKRALELMRQNQQVGSCSFDNGPLTQQKRIAELAAQTLNWGVFIKSFLNIMNDNVIRNANSNIASDSRETYITELTKLDLNVDQILLGSNVRIADTSNKHYFSDGSKIAKAYADLSPQRQQYFENTIHDIIKDKTLDSFNKLHFYNTYKSFHYFLIDTSEKKRVENRIKNLVPLLPNEIKSRVENPNKELCDLLYREKNELDKFDIESSAIGNIYSYSYGGDCWKAKLADKGSTGKINYNLTMAIGEEVTPLKNFLDKKIELRSRVQNHAFLQKILDKSSERKLYIMFTNDKSFANHRNRIKEAMPVELNSKLDFNNAISLYISFSGRKDVHFILLSNGNLLLLDIPAAFELPGFKFDDLITKEVINENKSFGTEYFKSFKLFNKNGEMLK